ncbi:M56 family metallopeptidase [Qipengyuania zhejiangensis]|uniref:M56 family metallopeptidase n=1 Tax=Qipengyuania zhejiangensis TaxID=3077782 RepID=UPI002D790B98|nr:M56 family metallopeptidase [Qipengyuania sp. Z2]
MTELVREYFDWFLLDTLLWTGALIGLVLVLRRPVARYLGPGAAYALWALPVIRLLFPPMTLPAWMGPQTGPVAAVPAPLIGPATDPAPLTYFGAVPETAAPAVLDSPVDLVTPLVLIWLVGAAVFLVRRFWLYAQLRAELLEDAVPVGDVGPIRLIETPAISGPMAFGVLDKVVALPVGFMVSRDRVSRDLAIAHELEHHRGHDLLANIMVQPVFAIHWFNPLGWMGWTALRRDQEAFCDARVVATRPREERAAYASVIADFARRPQVAPRPVLAAPMACPVLGDKSIIHRLRNLSMNEVSPRRRVVARSGIVAALFALPMTASICYASAAAAPPAPPQAPAAPLAPDAPPPPEAPAAPQDVELDIEMAELDREMAELDRELADVEREVEEIHGEDGRVERRVIVRRKGEGANSERHVEHRIIRDHEGMTQEERAELTREMAELSAKFAEDGEIRREIRMAFSEARAGMAQARAGAAAARAAAPRVVVSCRDKENIVSTETGKDGTTTMFVCEANADKIALKAMKSARKAIEIDRNLSAAERAEALRSLDAEIARVSR